MTATDLQQLVSLAGTAQSDHSPVAFGAPGSIGQPDQEASRQALVKLGLVQGDRLSPIGESIIAALLAPERVVTTVNAAMVDNAPVSYCYTQGIWTVLAPDIQYQMISIFDPLGPEDIAAFARQNLLNGFVAPAYEPFALTLSVAEAVAFEMSQLAIMGRAEAAGRPLTGDEQWFTAADILSTDHVYLMVEAFRTILPESELDPFLTGVIDASLLLQAIGGLVEKRVLEMYDAGSEQFYVHTLGTRQWLMANRLIDRIVVQAAWPVGETSYYHLTQSGILGVQNVGDQITYQSLPDFGLDLFTNMA